MLSRRVGASMQIGLQCRQAADATCLLDAYLGYQCGYRAAPGFSGVFPGGFAAVTASLRSDRSERSVYLIVRVLGQIVFVGQEGPDTSQLQDALAAVQNG